MRSRWRNTTARSGRDPPGRSTGPRTSPPPVQLHHALACARVSLPDGLGLRLADGLAKFLEVVAGGGIGVELDATGRIEVHPRGWSSPQQRDT